MNLKKTFSGLMTNKYFLYFIVFLSATNIIGYLTMNNNDAVIFFALVGFLMFNFSKNMTIVLLVSVIATNLFMVLKQFRPAEGFRQGGVGRGGKANAGGNLSNPTGSIDESFENKEEDVEDVEEEVEDVEEEEEEEEDQQVEFKKMKKNQKKKRPLTENLSSKTNRSGFTNNLSPAPVKKSSHIDYATTLEDAYKNLEKMLGSGGLQNLTDDTKKLMEQQTQLFNSMENIAPLLSQAQQMMKGMDLDQMNKFASASKSFNKTDA